MAVATKEVEAIAGVVAEPELAAAAEPVPPAVEAEPALAVAGKVVAEHVSVAGKGAVERV